MPSMEGKSIPDARNYQSRRFHDMVGLINQHPLCRSEPPLFLPDFRKSVETENKLSRHMTLWATVCKTCISNSLSFF